MDNIIAATDLPIKDGFDLRAIIVPDSDEAPSPIEEGGSYTPTQVKAFARGDWDYVGLIVVASVGDIDLGRASLWGVEHGRLPLNREDAALAVTRFVETRFIDPLSKIVSDRHYAIEDLVDEAIEDARQNLAAINAKLAAEVSA